MGVKDFSGAQDFDEVLSKLIDLGTPLNTALETAVVLSWRGKLEPVQITTCTDVRCVCGTRFTFKAGAVKALCPGCHCRYKIEPPR